MLSEPLTRILSVRLVLLNCHWQPKGEAPATITENVAFDPTNTAWLCGCVVTKGELWDATSILSKYQPGPTEPSLLAV